MQEQIGKIAGNLWQTLKANHEMPLSQVPKSVKTTDAVAYQALGWLAREGKVAYRTNGRRTYVSLTATE